MVLAFIAVVVGVRLYLRDMTEISLLEKAEADRRLKPAATQRQRQSVIEYVEAQYERLSTALYDRVEQCKNRFKGNRKKTATVLFGIEVDPPHHKFPIKAGKLKIFLGFFQIFGNFRDTFVIKWSPDVQNIMSISAKFNLVRYPRWLRHLSETNQCVRFSAGSRRGCRNRLHLHHNLLLQFHVRRATSTK